MDLNITRFGDNEKIITNVINRPIGEIVDFLNAELEDGLSVTQYKVNDDISAEIMNAPLIEVRDYLNGVAECSGTLTLDLYENGEDVTAAVLNRPIDQITDFINNECTFSDKIDPSQPGNIDFYAGGTMVAVSDSPTPVLWAVRHGESKSEDEKYKYIVGYELDSNNDIPDDNDYIIKIDYLLTFENGTTKPWGILKFPLQRLQDAGYSGSGGFYAVNEIKSLTANSTGCYALSAIERKENDSTYVSEADPCFGVMKLGTGGSVEWISVIDDWLPNYDANEFIDHRLTIIKATEDYIIAAASTGICCLDPSTGDVIWKLVTNNTNISGGGVQWPASGTVIETVDGRETNIADQLLNTNDVTNYFQEGMLRISPDETKIAVISGRWPQENGDRGISQILTFDITNGDLLDFYFVSEYTHLWDFRDNDSSHMVMVNREADKFYYYNNGKLINSVNFTEAGLPPSATYSGAYRVYGIKNIGNSKLICVFAVYRGGSPKEEETVFLIEYDFRTEKFSNKTPIMPAGESDNYVSFDKPSFNLMRSEYLYIDKNRTAMIQLKQPRNIGDGLIDLVVIDY